MRCILLVCAVLTFWCTSVGAQTTLTIFTSADVSGYSDWTSYQWLFDSDLTPPPDAYDANYHFYHPAYALGHAKGTGSGASSQSDVRSTTEAIGGANGESKAKAVTTCKATVDAAGTIDVTLRGTWNTPNPVTAYENHVCTVNASADLGDNSMQLHGSLETALIGEWMFLFTHGSDQPIYLIGSGQVGGFQFTRTTTPLVKDQDVSWFTESVVKSKEHPALSSTFAEVTLN